MKNIDEALWGMGAHLRVGSVAVVLGAWAGLAACGNGGLEGGIDPDDPPPVTPSNLYRVIPQSTTPRVDLPGRITTFVQVVDNLDQPVPNLPESQFSLYENGGPVSATESGQRIRRDPQTFRTFAHLLVDRSNSVSDIEIDIQEGARLFVAELLGRETLVPTDLSDRNNPILGEYGPPDPGRVATTFIRISWFDGSPTVHPIAGAVEGFTNDVELLEGAIEVLFDEPPFNGSTNLYGAVLGGLDALDEVDLEAQQQGIQNRTLSLVTFTDGTHQAGNALTLADVEMRLAEQVAGRDKYGAFSIGFGLEIDPGVLTAIGPQGTASNLPDLVATFDSVIGRVNNLANSFYALAYCSPKLSGTHELEIGAATATIPQPSPSSGPLEFVADGFGAGCSFLDARTYPELVGGYENVVFSCAIEDLQGRVIAVGWRGDGCTRPGCAANSQSFLVRFRADGTLDPSLPNSTNGLIVLSQPQIAAGATSVVSLGEGASQDTERFAVCGWRASAGGAGSEAALWDVLVNDGAMQPSTTTMPIPIAPQGAGSEVMWDLVYEEAATQRRLFCCGSVDMPSPRAAVWAILPNNYYSLDTAHWSATGGQFVDPAPLGEESRVARAIDLLGNLGVVIAGDGPTDFPSTVNGGRDVTVMSIDPATGVLDSSFGTAGRVVATEAFRTPSSGPVFPGKATDVRVDGFGRIVVAGTLFATSGGGPTEQPAAWRLLTNGAPDSMGFYGSPSSVFPGTGLVTLRNGSTQNPGVDFGRETQANGLWIGAGGEVLLVGARNNVENHRDMALVSFRESGSPDTYNTVGFVIEDGASGDDSDDVGQVVLRHSDGTVWVLGASRPAGAMADVPVVWLDGEHEGLFGGN